MPMERIGQNQRRRVCFVEFVVAAPARGAKSATSDCILLFRLRLVNNCYLVKYPILNFQANYAHCKFCAYGGRFVDRCGGPIGSIGSLLRYLATHRCTFWNTLHLLVWLSFKIWEIMKIIKDFESSSISKTCKLYRHSSQVKHAMKKKSLEIFASLPKCGLNPSLPE